MKPLENARFQVTSGTTDPPAEKPIPLTEITKNVIENAKLLPPAKRSVLKVVAQVYDPLGWISPVVITIKILFQKLCMDKEDWDTPLKKEHRELFERWIKDLEQVGTISLSKCYFPGVAGEVKSVQLHGV